MKTIIYIANLCYVMTVMSLVTLKLKIVANNKKI